MEKKVNLVKEKIIFFVGMPIILLPVILLLYYCLIFFCLILALVDDSTKGGRIVPVSDYINCDKINTLDSEEFEYIMIDYDRKYKYTDSKDLTNVMITDTDTYTVSLNGNINLYEYESRIMYYNDYYYTCTQIDNINYIVKFNKDEITYN